MNGIPLEDQQARRIEARIGARGPFDEDKNATDVLRRVNDFLLRTGLDDYTQYFKIGAFLARRPFGKQQAEFLKQQHKEEDRACQDEERRLGEANATLEGARLGRPNIDVGPTAIDDDLQLRRKYDLDQLMKEGDRGRWTIYIRQNWHVHALIFCCSLGAVIQGWDESAINGGNTHIWKREEILNVG